MKFIVPLSDKDLTKLADKVKKLRAAVMDYTKPQLEDALSGLNAIIARSPSAHYYHDRALVHFALRNHCEALGDLAKAIELEPDRPIHYLARAYIKTGEALSKLREKSDWTWSFSMDDPAPVARDQVELILADYKSICRKDPTIAENWKGMIACNILLNEWDEVISLCGQSKSFITYPDDKAVISWLLCLALVLAGDAVSEEDVRPLTEVDSVDYVYIELVMAHMAQWCDDSRKPERYRERVVALNELVLDRIVDTERCLNICRKCQYKKKVIDILDLRLEQKPGDYDAWYDRAEALQDLIEDDVTREMQWPPRKEAYGDSRFMELCKLDSRNEGIIHSYSKAAELAP
ncbi:MAG: hypothetical protein ACYC1U_11155, partial [Candidatus Aquicultorales bacterium]